MSMHLLPAWVTTTNTRKRKKSKKSASLIEAERQHAKFLKRIGYVGDKCSDSTASSNLARVGLTPTSPATLLPSAAKAKTGSIGNACKKDEQYKIEVSKKYTVAPAYNKGAYQVIGKNDIKNIGR